MDEEIKRAHAQALAGMRPELSAALRYLVARVDEQMRCTNATRSGIDCQEGCAAAPEGEGDAP